LKRKNVVIHVSGGFMLKVTGLDAYYGDVQVLWGVSLRVEEGRIVSVIGPNGAGKSTLLKAVMGLIPPRGGDGKGAVIFRGKILDGMAAEKVVYLGLTLVPEGARVFPEMTCLDNLKLGAYSLKDPTRQSRLLEEVMDLLPKLGERAKQKAKTLSGGERQMLAIGRALMMDPDFLLLDEPSLGLHPLMVSHIFKALEEINRLGKTILLVEQKVTFALKMSHYGYVLENGRMILEGRGADLMSDPHVRKAYLAM
jgi:branched-chain amino acid transport system ATP-binding protein